MRVMVRVKPRDYTRDFMPNIEDDPIFIEGFQKGLEIAKEKAMGQRTRAFVTNLLLHTDCTNEKIASLANVTLAFVEDVAKSLESK
jgi:hypothetical protein